MNNRQNEICRILLSESDPDRLLLIQDLADQAGCSEKTIRSDLTAIDEYISKYPNAAIVRKPGRGIYLEMGEADRSELSRELHSLEAGGGRESDEQRMLQIAFRLLMNPKPVAVQELAELYYVNKAVIRKDLERIEGWLQTFNLNLISRQRVGISVDGPEKAKRLALARLDQLIDRPELTGQLIQKQFQPHEVAAVSGELKEFQKRHSLYFTDEAFDSLLLHILLMIKRTKLHQPIALSDKEIAFLQEKEEFAWATDYLIRLRPVFAVSFPPEEAAYLTLHLLGGKFRFRQESGAWRRVDVADGNPLLLRLLDRLTLKMSEISMVPFSKDKVLEKGLKVHLYTTLNRLQYGLPVSNPMLAEIKNMYPYMFDRVISALDEIRDELGLSIPEEEAAYLTLHFQASVERLHENHNSPKKAIIVCHMGIGISQLLRTKIERKFPALQVEAAMAKAEVQDYVSRHEVDLAISTIPLPDLAIPHILVSPLLETRDEQKLEEKLKNWAEPGAADREDSAFLSYTSPFLIFLRQEASSPEVVIRKLAERLMDKGYARQGYLESALSREVLSSTTIGGGIAIPHGSPELITQSAVAIAALHTPVTWGKEKVQLVFMLAVRHEEREQMRRLFKELSIISERPSLVRSLAQETDVMKFLSRLKSETK
ncbi:transcription antiterminator [Paenibacillus sp. HN-1]|uniref:BglG family transcription antiterminator n=1 Tax=Paenibacillus TaxID=44249 RepID=UPI001CA7E5A1|nr:MULTISPECIES: BglG family transcription antiterminator [Paenibacillus]MBY9077900.1 transcription antiterminator [Paenibacillus sp. CGMCC 1.18879]MBY9088144.1 transcription antiterminator [Paenibacillus sinensis]